MRLLLLILRPVNRNWPFAAQRDLPNVYRCGHKQLNTVQAAPSRCIMQCQCASIGPFVARNCPRMHWAGHVHADGHARQIRVQLMGMHSVQILVASALVVVIVVVAVVVHLI